MDNMTTHTKEPLKDWFEQNYLDGDKVQKGQMLSSEVCLEAIAQALQSRDREIVGWIEDMIMPEQGLPPILVAPTKYRNETLSDLKDRIQNHGK